MTDRSLTAAPPDRNREYSPSNDLAAIARDFAFVRQPMAGFPSRGAPQELNGILSVTGPRGQQQIKRAITGR